MPTAAATPCQKCQGEGFIKAYQNRPDGGKCFRCRGSKVEPDYAKVPVQETPTRVITEEAFYRRYPDKASRKVRERHPEWFAESTKAYVELPPIETPHVHSPGKVERAGKNYVSYCACGHKLGRIMKVEAQKLGLL